jgi:hypothetical protein
LASLKGRLGCSAAVGPERTFLLSSRVAFGRLVDEHDVGPPRVRWANPIMSASASRLTSRPAGRALSRAPRFERSRSLGGRTCRSRGPPRRSLRWCAPRRHDAAAAT